MKKYLYEILLAAISIQAPSLLATEQQLGNQTAIFHSADFTPYALHSQPDDQPRYAYTPNTNSQPFDESKREILLPLNRNDPNLTIVGLYKHQGNINRGSFSSNKFGQQDLKLPVYDFCRKLPGFDSFLPRWRSEPKPIVRGGIELPYINPNELGMVDFFRDYGVDISSPYDLQSFIFMKGPSLKNVIPKFTYEPIKFEPIKIILPTYEDTLEKLARESEEKDPLKEVNFQPPLSEQEEVELIEGDEASEKKHKDLPEELAPYKAEKELIKAPLAQLVESEIIELFKYLTCSYVSINADSFKKLKELIQDPRARGIILATSAGPEDHIQNAISKAWFREPNILQILFSHSEIVTHLGSREKEEEKEFLLTKLKGAIHLNFDQVVPTFYKSEFVFQYLFSTIRNKKGSAIERLVNIDKIFFDVGLVMSFSSQAGKEFEKLKHPSLIRYIEKDTKTLSRLFKQSIEERNPHLASFLIEDYRSSISTKLLQKAIKIPTLWNILSEVAQQDILKKIQTSDPDFTTEQLQAGHKFLKASEHALTRHPALLEDMTLYHPGLAQSYQDVLAKLQETDHSHKAYLDLLAQKIDLERVFIDKLKELNHGALSTPAWSHAEADFAYNHKFFGQGVTSLVVELAELPEHQKDRLLKEHLGEKTFYRKKTISRNTNHNIGVTSLVTQMAPLSKVVSLTTKQIENLKEAIHAGEYPFINCSWGPVSALGDDTISIFSSVSILNNLLGREDVVLIKSAGNEGISLSDPNLKGEPAGILFSKLLQRIQPAHMINLLLAINLKPNNEIMSSSNIPGDSSDIFRNALSAQGSQIFWLDETGNEYLPIQDGGTSSAAPGITGAASLLKSYKLHFSPVLIKNCLLHSGIREFMIYNDDGQPREWIYENQPKEELNVPQSPYSFNKYGMGILSVKSAFAFADILDTYITDLKERNIESAITYETYEDLRKRLTKSVAGI